MMTSRAATILTLAALAVVAAHPAAAQQPAAWEGVGFLSVDAGVRAGSTAYDSTTAYTLNVEEATVAASYDIRPGPIFGARGGVRLWKHLALGAGVTFFSRTGAADVNARLPHPFYLDQHREASAAPGGFERQETMYSAEASWLIRVGEKLDVVVFGGPAFFTATQTLAGRARYTEAYPYDEVTLTDVERTRASASAAGFTAGADVAYMFKASVGLGALVRFSRASASLDANDTRGGSVSLGGIQASGGLRFRF